MHGLNKPGISLVLLPVHGINKSYQLFVHGCNMVYLHLACFAQCSCTWYKLRALTRIWKIGVQMLPSRISWSFTIQFHKHFSKSWSQIQKVGGKNSKFGANETSVNCITVYLFCCMYMILPCFVPCTPWRLHPGQGAC